MLSPLRKRAGKRLREPFGKAGLAVAVIALVFAMLGGAYAASHRHDKKGSSAGLTSKQKKEVKKLAEQYAGKNGENGAPGQNGAPGAKGDPGSSGSGGADGASVLISEPAPGCGTPGGVTLEVEGIPASKKEVCNGGDGTDGLDGKSVTATPIPSGETECEGRGGLEVEVEGESPNYICNGSVGQDAGFNYVFSTSTAASDPGLGKFALNNASPGSATLLSVSETDKDSNGLEAVIKKWTTGQSTQGTLMIRKAGSPSTFAEYSVRGGIACTSAQQATMPYECGMTDEGTFENINVAFLAGNGSLAADDPITVAYTSSGSSTLPPGALETGTWSFTRSVEEVETEVGGVIKHEKVGDSLPISVPLSFSTPIPAFIAGSKVHYSTDADYATFCGGLGASFPKPINSNELCVAAGSPVVGAEFDAICRPDSDIFGSCLEFESGVGRHNTGAGRDGAVLGFFPPTADAKGTGTYAIRG